MKIRASARKFEVSLGEKEEDLALHFKSQFSGPGSRGIVLNSRREGRWQSEQRYPNFPFQQGTDTKVVINFSASGFEVVLPDGQKLSFPNRQGVEKLTYMRVKGHIRVKSLTIQ
ncbi:galectin-1-like [Lepisosteus oculatus]|uniref:galectin-1-like n=1 Tax=Lepisosteus oculatus TaxID=7918 RepID=UPI0035F5201B